MADPEPLVEDLDYYVEDGRWVFTELFLRKRGYCCRSGCRHCPYGFRKTGDAGGIPSDPQPPVTEPDSTPP
jgi:hypothetical protein